MRIVLLVLLALGCGPSQREVALAKTATFRGDPLVMYQRMFEVIDSKYKIERADETKLTIETVARWYNPEGQGISGAGEQNVFNIPDRSIKLALIAELLAVDRDWVVQVRPTMIRFRVGQSAPDRIFPNEILPGWVPGKVDQLQYEIYEALRSFEVTQPGGNIPPAPQQRPSADPDEPGPAAGSASAVEPTPPAAGSATPTPPASGSATAP